jgi:small conductance mechanosensitive channel
MPETFGQIQHWIVLYGLNVVGAIAILVLGIIASGMVVGLIRKLMRKAKTDETLVSFGGNFIKFALYAFVIIAALNQLGFQTGSLIAVFGAAGLAVGLAMQSNLANLAAGVMILIFRPFGIGEMIEASGTLGKVETITILSTKLRAPDGKLVILPNNKIFTDKLINFSAAKIRRIDLVLGIGYDDDIKKAKDLFMDIVTSHPKVLKNPAPTVQVLELADSSVNFAVRPWVNNTDWWNTKCELTEQVKLRCDLAGISIPYPQQDLHLHQESPPAEQATVQ